jgi:hypothetical protein
LDLRAGNRAKKFARVSGSQALDVALVKKMAKAAVLSMSREFSHPTTRRIHYDRLDRARQRLQRDLEGLAGGGSNDVDGNGLLAKAEAANGDRARPCRNVHKRESAIVLGTHRTHHPTVLSERNLGTRNGLARIVEYNAANGSRRRGRSSRFLRVERKLQRGG